MNNVMLAKDSISAALAECYVTIGERRYNLMTAIKLEANFRRTRQRFQLLARQEREISRYHGKEPDLVQYIIIRAFSVK